MKNDETPRHTPGAMTDHAAPARVRGLPSRLLAVNALHADRLVNDGLAAEGARKWHFAALTALTEGGPASQSDLSRRTGIYRSDMVAVVNELAERGLVERTPDPADRRRNVITVTTEDAPTSGDSTPSSTRPRTPCSPPSTPTTAPASRSC